MTETGLTFLLVAVLFGLYTYAGYPLALWVLARVRPAPPLPSGEPPGGWPMVSVTVPAYNEEHQIADTIESLLALEYPADRRRILIVSDASDDGTDDIIRSYEDRGVTLVRQPERRGKTAAENAVAPLLEGDFVLNTDASIRIHPGTLKRMVAPFADPSVGLTSGRDVSVGVEGDANTGEAGYVGYEMWVRSLETRVRGIVGASGCCYCIRRSLHGIMLPSSLSRDFAAALNCHDRGYRAVSLNAATCAVPRSSDLKKEYSRKVRTITRGMETLWHKRARMNPLRDPLFSWMLLSHKVCRWLVPWFVLVGLIGLGLLAPVSSAAAAALIAALLVLGVGAGAWLISGDRSLPRVLSIPAYLVAGNVAAAHAALRALRGDRDPVWEPTRRPV